MRMPTRILAAALFAVAMVRAEQPSASFACFNDWTNSDFKGVRIDSDGRLRLGPNLRRVAQLPEGVVWAAVSDGASGAYLSAGNEGKLFHYVAGQMKPHDKHATPLCVWHHRRQHTIRYLWPL